jgi:hypothetical protein
MPMGENRGSWRVSGESRRWGMTVSEGRANVWRRVPTRLSSRWLDIESSCLGRGKDSGGCAGWRE